MLALGALRFGYNSLMSDFDAEQAVARLDRIQRLIDKLTKSHSDVIEQQDIAERLQRELALARAALTPFLNHKLGV